MHQDGTRSLAPWQHDHRFGLHRRRGAERRTGTVAIITLVTMVAEIAGGLAFGSMALLADGLHMGSHALALGISALAYVWMRRSAGDERYALGTGKIAALSGYTGAILLLVPAASMAWESVERLVTPKPIDFGWALMVAVIGLIVNIVCAIILQRRGDHAHPHDHGHVHGPGHRDDHNLRSAYLHVIADAATSVLAIVALAAGAYWGQVWLDPAMGIVGAVLIVIWASGLLRDSSHVLLDRAARMSVREGVRRAIEKDRDNRLADFHVWSIGPGIYAAALSVVTHHPQPPDHYKALIPDSLGIAHVTVEVHGCPEGG
jgi:cation diffusion facilitator family transporter